MGTGECDDKHCIQGKGVEIYLIIACQFISSRNAHNLIFQIYLIFGLRGIHTY